MSDFTVPSWVVGILPLVAIVITWVVLRVPVLADLGKRNVAAVVAFVITCIVVWTDHPAVGGADVMAYAGSIVGLLLYVWKGAQIIYDLLTGQLNTPDGHAELVD